ncbi:DUF370 domain-containing protein [Lentibacillus cibarius]|uniref:DUF370 domain-containing protein n=1 Tax=Lentibacillus cibarius TaxID=2583219 RepID=A0A549YGP8_9BACI|nr:extracellular matrix/biofilm biosynthesis regulator RemA family protein [Lentibacillus cibarius]TRM11063.1 DUF370 domain-containing protein [Lentibacillus cibarius]
MFIHIGNDHVIREEDVVLIIDRNMITSSVIMEELMDNANVKQKVYGPSDEAKSVIITTEQIYYSSLSVAALEKRAGMVSTISKLDDFVEELE